MPSLKTECPGCRGTNYSPLVEGLTDIEYDAAGTYSVVQCRECDFRFLTPQPTAAYPENYYTRWPARAGWLPSLALKIRYYLRWRRVQAFGPQPARAVVEIGCGDGNFLRFLADRSKATLWGVDTHSPSHPDPRIHWIAKPVALAQLPEPADILFLYETLEHVVAPLETLARLRTNLSSDGIIVGTVPRWGSLWHRLFPRHWQGLSAPRHLSFFEPESLKRLLAKAGLELVTLRPILDPGDLSVTLANWLCDKFAIKTPPRQTWFFFPLTLLALPVELLRLAANRSGQMEFVARPCVR